MSSLSVELDYPRLILVKSTVRAGLIPAYPLGVHEPHGDMDVMLSIRTQGIMTSVTRPATSISVTEKSFSSRSVHSLKTAVKPPASPTSLSALKGLFIGRPRSGSRPASIDTERDQERESFPTLGNGPPNMLRSSTPDSPSAVTVQGVSAVQTGIEPIGYLDRRIRTAPHPSWTRSTPTNVEAAAHKADIILPLQPPPRKRWTASGLSTLNTNVDSHAVSYSGRPNSLQVQNMSMDKSELDLSSPLQVDFGTPEYRPRASSLQSVSTFASGDHRISTERSSTSTKRSSTRRWSKQSLLPSPMSPPIDPPPPVPHQANANTSPSFSKRTSGESSRSTTSSGKYSSQGMRVRSSVPPPRPAPTSALPPAPIDVDQDELNHDVLKPLETISSTPKTPFRASSVHRSSRLSMVAPKPPPSTNLPPRPDDPDYQISHHRSSSESRYPTTLESIPGSPLPPTARQDANLPPQDSLPQPILPLPVPPVAQIPGSNRVASLKQRLRMLSTSSVSAVPAIGRSRLSTDRSSIDSAIQPTFSPPSTPIAEKIMPIQDDSFLQLYTPITPTAPFIPQISSHDSETVALTSLSPPPRRGLKQTLESDYLFANNTSDEQLCTIDQKTHLLASPPLSPRRQNSHLLPEVASDGWMLSDDSSGTETQQTSFLDSEHDVSTSRPSSIISLGLI